MFFFCVYTSSLQTWLKATLGMGLQEKLLFLSENNSEVLKVGIDIPLKTVILSNHCFCCCSRGGGHTHCHICGTVRVTISFFFPPLEHSPNKNQIKIQKSYFFFFRSNIDWKTPSMSISSRRYNLFTSTLTWR